MASVLEYFTGWESGSFREAYNPYGAVSVVDTEANSGDFSLRVNLGVGTPAFASLKPPARTDGEMDADHWGANEIYVTFHLWVTTLPASGTAQFFRISNLGVVGITLEISSTGVVTLHDQGGGTLATSSIILGIEQWYRLDVHQKRVDVGTSEYELKIDGVQAAVGSDTTWSTNNVSEIFFGSYATPTVTYDMLYDDIVICTIDYIGTPVEVLGLVPIAIGFHDEFPGAYTEIDDRPPDGDTTYIQPTEVTTVKKSFLCTDIAALSGDQQIAGIKTFHMLKRHLSASLGKIFIRSNATDYILPNAATYPTNYTASYCQLFLTDPGHGDAAWTSDYVNALEIGDEITTAVLNRGPQWTASNLHILYVGEKDAVCLGQLFHLSDYPSADTGVVGGYDASCRFFFPNLDFGTPDRVKQLRHVEIVYESLRELPINVKIWKRYPIADSGTLYEAESYSTGAVQADEPGVFYNIATPVWGTARYGTMRTFHARVEFDMLTAMAFDAGFTVGSDLTPFRLIQLAWNYHTVRGGARATLK